MSHVSRIARGIPVGGDLEYADEVTLVRALQGRHELGVSRRSMRYLINEALLRLVKPTIALVLGLLLYWLITAVLGEPGSASWGWPAGSVPARSSCSRRTASSSLEPLLRARPSSAAWPSTRL